MEHNQGIKISDNTKYKTLQKHVNKSRDGTIIFTVIRNKRERET